MVAGGGSRVDEPGVDPLPPQCRKVRLSGQCFLIPIKFNVFDRHKPISCLRPVAGLLNMVCLFDMKT